MLVYVFLPYVYYMEPQNCYIFIVLLNVYVDVI